MSNSLRQQWDQLNAERASRKLQPFSYTHLASLAASPDIPGDAIEISKATVAALMNGRYSSATRVPYTKRLQAVIAQHMADLGIVQAEPRRHSTPRVKLYRCSYQGYIEYRNQTYYLGGHFASQLCTVTPLREGKAKGIRVTTPYASRDVYPVDASTNQLGYKVER